MYLMRLQFTQGFYLKYLVVQKQKVIRRENSHQSRMHKLRMMSSEFCIQCLWASWGAAAQGGMFDSCRNPNKHFASIRSVSKHHQELDRHPSIDDHSSYFPIHHRDWKTCNTLMNGFLSLQKRKIYNHLMIINWDWL